jgi:hypothetical protein
VGVVQPGSRPRLALEASLLPGVVVQFLRQHLERDPPTE